MEIYFVHCYFSNCGIVLNSILKKKKILLLARCCCVTNVDTIAENNLQKVASIYIYINLTKHDEEKKRKRDNLCSRTSRKIDLSIDVFMFICMFPWIVV